jgi:hypothetical protein
VVAKRRTTPEAGETWTASRCRRSRGRARKGFAIRETIGMFGARLLNDIYERPEFYFVRREIARTDAEIKLTSASSCSRSIRRRS